jgi:branched-chain amino acid transport system substrate-binding protein
VTVRLGVVRRLVATAAAAALLVGCSSVGELLGRDQDRGPRVVKIVVMTPAEGAAATAGAGVLAAVQLAVEDRALAIPDWTVEVTSVVEPGDRAAAAALADDPEVVAVVGGLTGEAVRTVQPVLAKASILFVSPADVAPEHTRGTDPAAPLRPYQSYFRTAVATGDAVATAADYAVAGLNAHRVVIIDGADGAEASRFAAEVRRLGSEVVLTASAGPDGAEIPAALAPVDAAKAEVIYVAGDAALAAKVAKALAGTGLDATLVGGAPLRSEDFVTAAGTAADGAVAVVDPLRTGGPGGASDDVVARLAERGVGEPGPYAEAAYDAGTAIADVLIRCLPPAGTAAGARPGCVAEMAQVSFAGITGDVAFDAFGDRAGTRPQVFQMRDEEWIELGSS